MNQIVTNLKTSQLPLDTQFDRDHVLGKMGNLVARLATTQKEIEALQALRFEVFHREFGARLSQESIQSECDVDVFDDACDHLIVLDTGIAGEPHEQIVGTYRLMRADHAQKTGGFYSASEFAVAALTMRHSNRNFLELGRSCVRERYRSKRIIELLWQGNWAYARQHKIDVMMGCASFNGTIPALYAEAMTFLNSQARTTGDWHVAPLPGRHVSMDLMPPEAVKLKSALAEMPPLIKGYLRLGAMFGDGAVIDHDFNTIDVLVVLPIENIASRYRAHYGENAERFAA